MKHNNFGKRFFTLALTAVFAIGGGFFAANSYAAAQTANVTATVIAPITNAKSVDLVFGKFAPGGGGSVIVSTSGARTTTGPILSSIGSSPTAAKFDITGDPNATYSISISTDGNISDNVSNTMTLAKCSDLTAGGTTTENVTSGTLDGTGAQSIYVGGTLTVGASQVANDYTGTFDVTVEYN